MGESWVVGIGNEVLIGLLLLIAVPGLMWFWVRRWLQPPGNQAIHGDAEQVVEEIRRHHPQAERARRAAEEGEVCGICLAPLSFPAELNCGHVFDANCFIEYWHSLNRREIQCPMCRRGITLMIPALGAGLWETNDGQALLAGDVFQFNQQFHGRPANFWSGVRDLPAVMRWFVDDVRHGRRNALRMLASFRSLFMILSAVLYLISPFDLIPEAVFGVIGFLDDGLVWLIVILAFAASYRRGVANQQEGRRR